MNSETGKWIIGIGAIIIIVGIIIYFFHDKLNWVGRLPGDIRIEKENFRFYFPIVSMILFSVLASLIIWLIRKFF
jgi:H+/Cl- antiporter ClcA